MNAMTLMAMEAEEVLAGKTPAVPAVTDELTTALVTGIGNAATSITSVITQVLPYALGVAGVIMAISFGYSIFRRFAH